MYTRAVAAAAAVVVWGLLGCFDPPEPPAGLACADRGCPDGQECIEGVCYSQGTQPGSDAGASGGGGDAGSGDGAVDADSGLTGWATKGGPSGAVARAMDFSPSYGWMAAELDFLWRSDDGGDTWADHGFPVSPRDVAAGSDDSAWVLAGGIERMWVSSGGEPFAEPEEQPGGGTLRGLAAASEAAAAVASDSSDHVFTTEDGGQVWERRELGTGFPGITDLDYAAGTLAAVGGPLSGQADDANVAVSTDFGENWVTQDLTDEAHDGEGGRLVSIVVTEEGAIWAAGPNRQLYHSAGGGSFDQIGGVPDGFGDFRAVAASGSHVVVAGVYEGSGGVGIGIYESTDGGESFAVGYRDTTCDCDVTGAAAHPDGTIWVHTSQGEFLTRRAF